MVTESTEGPGGVIVLTLHVTDKQFSLILQSRGNPEEGWDRLTLGHWVQVVPEVHV